VVPKDELNSSNKISFLNQYESNQTNRMQMLISSAQWPVFWCGSLIWSMRSSKLLNCTVSTPWKFQG